ncbi:MAG: MGMT family protein [Anaerolineales bacterium]|jgi:methylated-DNA-protein-cysteine methyltransferase-like protein
MGTRQDFDEQVYALCMKIPAGRVMTYGSIGAQIPPPVDMNPVSYDRIKARWVGYALKRCPEEVPWHRVVNARGEISRRPGFELQRALLLDEGVQFIDNRRIDLKRYVWKPDHHRTKE